jgi:hypothetical protein
MSSQVHKVLAEPDGPASYGHVVNLYSVCLRIHTLAKDRPTMHLGGSVVSSPGPVVWCASQCTSRKAEKAAGQARNSPLSQLTLAFFWSLCCRARRDCVTAELGGTVLCKSRDMPSLGGRKEIKQMAVMDF